MYPSKLVTEKLQELRNEPNETLSRMSFEEYTDAVWNAAIEHSVNTRQIQNLIEDAYSEGYENGWEEGCEEYDSK